MESENLLNIHSDYGVSLKDRSWVPAPRYLLRRYRLLKLFKSLEPGRVLEVGCGAGGIMHDLHHLGFSCEAVETSSQARSVAKKILSGLLSVTLHSSNENNWNSSFDYLASFDVLEHIEDDKGALLEWVSWLKPNGSVILSVPAHQSKFGHLDVWAGHYRRYDKEDIWRLLENCGLHCLHFETYGFPLANLTSIVRNYIFARKQEDSEGGKKHNNTEKSGVDRKMEGGFYGLQCSFFGRIAMKLCCTIQAPFSRSDLGDGYIIVARKAL